ncbi:exodeoxyribonuclease V subunit alpha [Endozoicomonas sp. OPT23]|uniref:exodeoxyribonuclease V subunit alpha n=1 Tax=Endozoicomonas sp. OPT23 TaxID=2072845 RepID=UPI00129A79A6|nr:exodeoxyribonuclease V subunit alpha [Endozoicomonas sp. OPT23]MRI34890.1 exodeoxyribonuclease V subunit alpha [Endozoicomonas sp. OPT23]
MLNALQQLMDNKKIRPLDYQFARLMSELDGNSLTTLSSALLSYELGKGNVCLPLSFFDQKVFFDQNAVTTADLKSCINLSGQPDADQLLSSPVIDNGQQLTPMVLDNDNLYFYRYWQHECAVAAFLNRSNKQAIDIDQARNILDRLFQRNYTFLQSVLDLQSDDSNLKEQLIKWLDIEHTDPIDWQACLQTVRTAQSPEQLQSLDTLIPQQYCLNWQKVAAALAACQPFCVISGGPGTGKTTTVTRLLAMLIEMGAQAGKIPDIKLVAPTGKASARLTESIGGALSGLHCTDEIRNLIPTQAGTIHRLLGVIPGSPDFRHHAGNQLHLDILVVDEASMIDLSLMRRLLDALPDHAQVILLGDRDQLASVDAGSVLGDICNAADGGYSEMQSEQLEQLTGFKMKEWQSDTDLPIRNRFCLLRKSYRFDARSGIGTLAKAVNEGNLPGIESAFSNSEFQDIQRHSLHDNDYDQMIRQAAQGYKYYLDAISEKLGERTIIKRFNQFRLLCALREGRYGVEGLNEAIRAQLARMNCLPSAGLWYTGRPVLITQNAHGLNLYNGDIGIALPDDNGKLKVVFELPDGSIKHLLPSRLPEHQTVFAMTIHKSQGSEFNHTMMVLPDQMVPVLSRELVYTGITRARKRLDIYCDNKVMGQSVIKRTERFSGLVERLML